MRFAVIGNNFVGKSSTDGPRSLAISNYQMAIVVLSMGFYGVLLRGMGMPVVGGDLDAMLWKPAIQIPRIFSGIP